jgi:hypothetical protein
LDVAPAAVLGEIQLAVRHLTEQRHHALFPLLLADVALRTRHQTDVQGREANLAVVVSHEFDDVGDFGGFLEQRGSRRRNSRRVLQRPAGRHFDVEF